MLTPQQLSSISDAVLAVFVELDTALKVEAVSRISKDPANIDRAAARAAMAAISSGANKKVSETVAQTLRGAVQASMNTDEQIYAAARLAGIIGPYAALQDSEVMTRIVSEGFASVDSMLSVVKTSALQAVNASFNDAIDSAIVGTVTGTPNTETVRNAVNKIAETTTKVTYMTATGEIIQQGLFSAVSRAVTTGTHQTVLRIQESRMKEVGADYVEVTAHSGARPEHSVWQGKVFRYPDELIQVTGYGTGEGLGGWNCRHTFYPYFPDIMEPLEARAIPDKKESDALYELEQRQRLCERNIRGYKQRAAIQEAGGQADDAAKSRALVKKWQKEATEITKQTGGRRRYDRERMDPISRITDPDIARKVTKKKPPIVPTEKAIEKAAEKVTAPAEPSFLNITKETIPDTDKARAMALLRDEYHTTPSEALLMKAGAEVRGELQDKQSAAVATLKANKEALPGARKSYAAKSNEVWQKEVDYRVEDHQKELLKLDEAYESGNITLREYYADRSKKVKAFHEDIDKAVNDAMVETLEHKALEKIRSEIVTSQKAVTEAALSTLKEYRAFGLGDLDYKKIVKTTATTKKQFDEAVELIPTHWLKILEETPKVIEAKGRKYGRGFYYPTQHKIQLDSLCENPYTAAHELMHATETKYDSFYLAEKAYLDRRGEGKPIKSLKTLTGNKAYGSDERAYDAGLFDPYAGKVYNHSSTEIMSMGLQHVFEDSTVFNQDIETLDFVLGMMLLM